MRIDQIFNSLGLTTGATRQVSGQEETATASESSGSSGASEAATLTSSTAALRNIAQDYDFTQITPDEFSEFLQRVEQAGVLNDQELSQLSQIRLFLEQQGDEDQPTNLVELLLERAQELQQEIAAPGEEGELQSAQNTALNQVQWINKLQTLSTTPGLESVDSLA